MGNYQRSEDMRVLLDGLRDKSEARAQRSSHLPLQELLQWLRTLESVTLNEYRRALSLPLTSGYGGRPWGDALDLLTAAGEDRLDDTYTALLLFTSGCINPMPRGSQAHSQGVSGVSIAHESFEYVTGLYDTLRYHSTSVPEHVAAPLLDGNVYLAAPESRDALSALLTVTDKVLHAGDLEEMLLTNNSYDMQPPHRHYSSLNDSGSLWLSNGELIRYILANPEDATFIAQIVVERKTDDVAAIAAVLEQDARSLGSGVL